MSRPRLLVVSAVRPFPAGAGQRQRVGLKLEALRPHFELGFASLAAPHEVNKVQSQLLDWVDRAFVLPSQYAGSAWRRLLIRSAYLPYALVTKLRPSNLIVGLELRPSRIRNLLGDWVPSAALFEYWHTWRTASALRRQGVATILDMHDLLYQTLDRDLGHVPHLPAFVRHHAVAGYRRREQASWCNFDLLLAINRTELQHAASTLGDPARVALVPMGVDIERWRYQWNPADPPRMAFYGGLGSPHNQREALRCLDKIMPLVWERNPEVELWVVGANPPESLLERMAGEPRLRVTGFLDNPAPTLASCRAVLCPWVGTYGFRSRLIEAMAVGVPIVATPDAVDGMALDRSEGVYLGADDRALADHALSLLDPAICLDASRLARAAVERLYSFDATYGQLPELVRQTIVRRCPVAETDR